MSTPALTDLSEEEALFRATVREFSENQIGPFVAEMDRDSEIKPDILKGLFELGLMGIEIPEAYGGAGASLFMSILAIEEISRVDPAVAVVVDVQNTLFVNAIKRWGTDDQKERFFPRLAADTISSYALSEESSGSDAFALRTTAKSDGDSFILNGRKLWISNSAESGLFLVFANADVSAGYKGITAFLVERDMDGFTVGKKEDKIGIRASSTCELLLEGVKVPKENVLGEIGQGYKIAIETLNEGRIGIGGQMVGLAQGALEGALEYAQQREQFGRKIMEFQAVGHALARCAADLETARLVVYNAARLRDSGKPYVREGAMAKLVSCSVAERVASQAVEIYGGIGITKDAPAEKFLRDAKPAQVYEGTEFMQLETIAKSLVKEGLS